MASARLAFAALSVLAGVLTLAPARAQDVAQGAAQAAHDVTPDAVHAASAPQHALSLIHILIGSQITARLMVRLTHYVRVPLVGLSIAITALAALAIDPDTHSIAKFVLLLFAFGCGLGPMYPCLLYTSRCV